MKKNLLGVKIDDVNKDEALSIVEGWLEGKGKHYVVTPNPEILVMAQDNTELKKVLNNADLAVPDGAGLRLFSGIVRNTPGTDLMEALCKRLSEKGSTIGFLGGGPGVAKKASERLIKKYPKLKVSFAESGGEIDQTGKSLKSLKLLKVDLLFVAFGPPKQELWISKNLEKIPVKVAMTVGGAFDFLSGIVPRAPLWVRVLGLEWLFRLIIQPWRIRRQLALIKYLMIILRYGSHQGPQRY